MARLCRFDAWKVREVRQLRDDGRERLEYWHHRTCRDCGRRQEKPARRSSRERTS